MRRWRVQVTPTPGPGTTPHLDDLRISGAGPHPLLHLCLCLPCVRAWLCPLNTVHVLGLFSLIGLCYQFPFQWQWVCITSCGILFSMQEVKFSLHWHCVTRYHVTSSIQHNKHSLGATVRLRRWLPHNWSYCYCYLVDLGAWQQTTVILS